MGPHTSLLYRDDVANFSFYFHGSGDDSIWTMDEDESGASVGASHRTPSESQCNQGYKFIFHGGVGDWQRWTAERTDLELRMGPHTLFHLRIGALRASDASSMAGKGREWTKASHLRVRASHQGFPKIRDSIAKTTKVFGLSFSILLKDGGGYIFIGDEGNGRGYLGIPKVPYILNSLRNSKDFMENEETSWKT